MKIRPRTPPEHDDAEALLPGELSSPSRRAFLRMAGFGVASGLFASCSRGPRQKIVPYLEAPVGVVSGRAYEVATTCRGCAAGCGVLARCRDGRPIKLEGNPEHGLSHGGLCAVGQADVLALYDARRAAAPIVAGREVAWDAALDAVRARLGAAGRGVRLLTGTVHSPSTRAAIARFLAAHPGAEHVAYDPLSAAAIPAAHARLFGVRALPALRLERARVLASFDADLLGTWVSPVGHAAGWAAARRPDDARPAPARMSRHHHFEARVSLTGLAADERTRLAPWELRGALLALCRALEARSGVPARLGGAASAGPLDARMEALADELWEARGEALVVCGANDVEAAALAVYANHLVDAYGRTLSLARPSHQRLGDDAALARLGDELAGGAVDVLLVSGVNPAYDLPLGLRAAIGRARTLVAHGAGLDETWAQAAIGLPEPHALERWDDAEPELARFALTQPAAPPLRDARTLRAVLAALLGDARPDDVLLREHWRAEIHPRFDRGEPFDAFFARALHDGYVELPSAGGAEPAFRAAALGAPPPSPRPDGLGLVLYPKVGLLAGEHAHNPWLQELPDPVTKATWDNYAALSPGRAAALGVGQGDLVRVDAGDGAPLVLPVLVQRGQHDDVVAVALGYGRLGTDRFAGVGPDWWEGRPTVAPGETVGVDAGSLLALHEGFLRTDVRAVRVERAGGRRVLATTQDHHALEVPEHLAPAHGAVRDALRTTTLGALATDPAHAVPGGHRPPPADLWPEDHPLEGRRWAMAIDLAACTGCSACVVGCQAENNVPVVGRDEVARHREMHWLRIDRYYAGEDDDLTAGHQPMLCQHCDHAPCESVCPVLATVHSSEGLNQQVYNRCVGTRYCANTCPYKVRRFNWFDYPREDRLQNHALNPDVAVRTRGVMEKCSFCAQRIQEAKAEAARRGVALADGDVRTACQQSCPTQAIVFGDANDPDSGVARAMRRRRAYGVLTELNVQPSIRYLARVRNRADREEHHG